MIIWQLVTKILYYHLARKHLGKYKRVFFFMGNGQAASRRDGYSKLIASEQQKPQQEELHHDNVLGLADFEERLAPRQDAAAAEKGSSGSDLWCRGRGGGSWKQRLLVMGAWAAFVVVSALLVAVSVLFSLALYRYVNRALHHSCPFHLSKSKYPLLMIN